MAAEEFRKTPRDVRRGLRLADIHPGKDGYYSTYDMLLAVSDMARLEKQAKEAKLQQVIDDAARAKLKREVEEGLMAPLQTLLNAHLDVLTQIVAFVRHSSMTAAEKQQLIRQVSEYDYAPAGQRGNGQIMKGSG